MITVISNQLIIKCLLKRPENAPVITVLNCLRIIYGLFNEDFYLFINYCGLFKLLKSLSNKCLSSMFLSFCMGFHLCTRNRFLLLTRALDFIYIYIEDINNLISQEPSFETSGSNDQGWTKHKYYPRQAIKLKI